MRKGCRDNALVNVTYPDLDAGSIGVEWRMRTKCARYPVRIVCLTQDSSIVKICRLKRSTV